MADQTALGNATDGTSSKPIRYKKNPGFCGNRGERFEYMMSAYLYLRLSEAKHPFYMASNIDRCGALDDIVINSRTPSGNICLFFQLKSKINQKINNKTLLTSFGLNKMCKSLEGVEKYIADGNICPFPVDLKNCFFILCTTANIETGFDPNTGVEPGPVELAKTRNQSGLIKLNEVKHKEVYEGLQGMPRHREFLDNLFILYNQASDDELDNIVRTALQTLKHLSNEDILLAFPEYTNAIIKWWQQESSPVCLDDKDTNYNPLNKADIMVKKIKRLRSEVETLDLQFTASALEEIRNSVSKNPVTVLLTPGRCILMTVAKVREALSSSKPAVENIHDLVKDKSTTLSDWKRKVFDTLVIQVDKPCQDMGVVCSDISQLMEKENTGQIVFLLSSEYSNEFSSVINKFKKISFQHINSEFSDLKEETKCDILGKIITFQGQQIPINRLEIQTLEPLSLFALLKKQNPVIGKPFSDVVSYYVDRKLRNERMVSCSVFRETNMNFALSGGTRSELYEFVPPEENINYFEHRSQSCKVVIIEREEEFDALCADAHNVCWLHKHDHHLVLKKSYGDSSIIVQHLNVWKPSNLLSENERVVILTSEPGMGKTTLLSHLCKATSAQVSGWWIVPVHMNELHMCREGDLQEEQVIELLASVAGVDTSNSLERELFVHSYKVTGNMVVLVDGVDEVFPDYWKEVQQLLKILNCSKVKKIWIASRDFLKEELETTVLAESYSLEPLSSEDQENFLVKFWKNKNELLTESNLELRAKKVIKLSCDHIVGNKKLMGNPLHCLFLAEHYSDINLMDPVPTRDLKINIAFICEKHFDKRVEICDQKLNGPNNLYKHIYMRKRGAPYKEDVEQNYMVAALCSLFSKDELGLLPESLLGAVQNKAETYLSSVREGCDEVGMISKVTVDRAQFVHHLFCEYFAAKWLSRNLEASTALLQHCFLKKEYKATRFFLDIFLSVDHPLHKEILNDCLTVNLDLHEIKELINSQDGGGRTPLHLAVTYSSPEITRFLMKHGADLTITDQWNGWTVIDYVNHQCESSEKHKMRDYRRLEEIKAEIMEARADTRDLWIHKEHSASDYKFQQIAAKHSLLDLLRFFKNRTDVNGKFVDASGTMLSVSCQHGQVKAVKELLKLGVDVRAESRALHAVALRGDLQIAKLLIENGINVNAVDTNGQSALHLAAVFKQYNIVELLVDNGVDIDKEDCSKNTPLICACRSGDTKIVNLLLREGAKVDGAIEHGTTPLLAAVRAGQEKVIEVLIRNRAALDYSKYNCPSPLSVAVEIGNVEICKLLMRYGARDHKENCSLLNIAARYGHLHIVKLLFTEGLSLSIESSDGRTPLFEAASNGCLEVAEFLLQNRVNVEHSARNPLCVAARNGHLRMVQFLVDHGASVNKVDSKDFPLSAAARNGHIEVVKLLLEKSARTNTVDEQGRTVLHAAAAGHGSCGSSDTECRHASIASLLLKRNVDVNAKNSNGFTALHYAAFNNHLDVCRVLLRSGRARVNSSDWSDNTPLSIALNRNHLDMCKLLVGFGADVNYVPRGGPSCC